MNKFILGTMFGLAVGIMAMLVVQVVMFDGVFLRSDSSHSVGLPTWIRDTKIKYKWDRVDFSKDWSGEVAGPVCSFQENGHISSMGHLQKIGADQYAKDKAWIYYDESGLITQIESYEKGKVDSALKFNGDNEIIVYVYDAGRLMDTVIFKSGK